MVLLVLTLFAAAACASGESEGEEGSGSGANSDDDAGPPQAGGRMVYGLEAETNNGWCLPSARLAISGIQVARSIYDTLTVVDGNGEFQPYLAESVEANADSTEWTITLKEGIKFHDGSDLTAEVVKNNLDAYRGQNPNITVDLFLFVFMPIQDISVVDPLTVKVTMKQPWVSFPSAIFGSGRVGMMAQAQLDNPETCNENLIGTGAFVLESPSDWQLNNHMTLRRNESYWRQDPDGNQLPYLDEIEFRPIPESQQRLNSLQSGEIDAFHSSSATESLVITELRDLSSSDEVNLTESDDFAEVGHLMLNMTEPPFDNILAREAASLAVDRATLNDDLANGIPVLANGPFAPGALGYLEDTGYGEYDPELAAEKVAQYEAETGTELEVQISSAPTPELTQLVEAVKGYWEDAGMTVSTTTFDQAQLITTAVNRDFQAITWRNFPGLDPDVNYNWWYGEGNPINFAGFNDPEINDLLDRGRVTADPAERQEIYEELNREFAKEKYLLWTSWIMWAVPTDPELHNVVGAMPLDGENPYTGLAIGHDMALMWREQ